MTKAKYEVKYYTGDYVERQEEANRDGAICYVEQHLNSREYQHEAWGLDDNPIICIVAHNASVKTKEWARLYCHLVKEAFPKIPLYNGTGLLQRQYRERGDYNLRFTKMPAILPEPFWLSDEEQVELLMQTNTQRTLGHALAISIQKMFPEGGLVAFSIGHKGKTSQPYDRGAPVRGYKHLSEASFSEAILYHAKKLLDREETVDCKEEIRKHIASLRSQADELEKKLDV